MPVGFHSRQSLLNSCATTLLECPFFGFFVYNRRFSDFYFLIILWIFLFSFRGMISSFGSVWSFILFIGRSCFYVDITLGFLSLTAILIYFFRLLDNGISIFIFTALIRSFLTFTIRTFALMKYPFRLILI